MFSNSVMCPYYKVDWFVANGYSAGRVWEIQEATRGLFRRYNVDSDTTNLTHSGGTPSSSSWADGQDQECSFSLNTLVY